VKKILILSYYFPPCSVTAANRLNSWAVYFKEFGLEPIIITRKWDHKISKPSDEYIQSSAGKEEMEFKTHKVLYTEYKPNLTERLYNEDQKNLNRIFYLIIRTCNRIGQNFSVQSHSYYRIYKEARKLLERESIDYLIVSGFPYGLFLMAHKLKKEFPSIKWIADYRDDWTTNSLVKGRNLAQKIILKLESISEKKWLSNSSLITTANNTVSNLEKLHDQKVTHIFNGHMINEKGSSSIEDGVIRIVYSGSIFLNQDFTFFKKALAILKNEEVNVHVTFLGSLFNTKECQVLKKFFIELDVHFTERLKRSEYLEELKRANAFLITPYPNVQDRTPSKIFDYIGLEKPIFLIPSDFGEIEKVLSRSGLGQVCNNEIEFVSTLKSLVKNNFDIKLNDHQMNYIKQFHRRYQTKKLAELILSA